MTSAAHMFHQELDPEPCGIFTADRATNLHLRADAVRRFNEGAAMGWSDAAWRGVAMRVPRAFRCTRGTQCAVPWLRAADTRVREWRYACTRHLRGHDPGILRAFPGTPMTRSPGSPRQSLSRIPVDGAETFSERCSGAAEKCPGGSRGREPQHGFALEVIARRFATTLQEARPKRPPGIYAALKPHLVRDPAARQNDDLSRRLAIRSLAPALARPRNRFGALANAEAARRIASRCALWHERRMPFAQLLGGE